MGLPLLQDLTCEPFDLDDIQAKGRFAATDGYNRATAYLLA